MAREHEAAHLSVGADIETAALLKRDRLIDRAILEPLEPIDGKCAFLVPAAGVEQPGGTEQAANHFGAVSYDQSDGCSLQGKRPGLGSHQHDATSIRLYEMSSGSISFSTT